MDIFGSSGGGEWLSWKSDANAWDMDGESCSPAKLLIDPASIKTGWGMVKRGASPDFVWADVPGTTIQQPSPEHRTAFSVMVYCSSKQGAVKDGVREWRSNARANVDAIKRVWADIHAAASANPGKWAVVDVAGSEKVETKFKDINVPILKLSGWADVPAQSAPAPMPTPEPAVETGDVVF